MDEHTIKVRDRYVLQCKVQWDQFSIDSATWEDADVMHQSFPHLFTQINTYVGIVVHLCYVELWILMDIGSMSLPSGEGCHDSNFDMLFIRT